MAGPQDDVVAELTIVSEGGSTRTLGLRESDPVVAGRSKDCHIHLEGDKRASRRHAQFEWRNGVLLVTDLGSSNGVKVNGARIADTVEVSPDDTVLVGSTAFKVDPIMGTVFEVKSEFCAGCGRVMGVGSVSGAQLSDEGIICRECARAGGTRRPEIAGYTIARLLGSGLMGQVFLAKVDETGQRVALKVLSPSRKPSSVKEAIERFTREAKALAKLDHPGAVRFVDSGVSGGFHYLAMEYVDGRDLQAKVRDDGPLTPDEVIRIGIALCDCLQAAHAQGIVHRDVKPSNVFRAKADGMVKLADFGLAHLAQSHGIGGSKLSTAGGGNPRYASPEQLKRLKDAGVPADVYGVGATLFFLLTGRPPFDHKSKAVAAVQAIEEPAPGVIGLRPDCPPALASVIARCLAKHPSDRFQSAKALAKALKQAAAG